MQIVKRAVLLGILLTIAFSINAQTLEWGAKNKAKSKWYSPIILSDNGEYVHSAHLVDKNIFINKYDNKGNVVFSNELKFKKINGDKTSIEDIKFINNKFILFVSTYNDPKDKAILYALSYSGTDGKKTGKEIKLFETPVERKSSKGAFTIKTSDDLSKILINHFAFYEKEGKYKDRYKLFDSEMNEIMDKTEISEFDYKTNNYVIDNDGSIYYVRAIFNATSIVSYDATKDYEKWEENIHISDLDRNQAVNDVKFAFDKNNDLIITGICTEKKKENPSQFKSYIDEYSATGAMYMKIDRKSKETKVLKVHRFPIETVLKVKHYSFAEQSMYFTPNNDLIFISEIFQYVTNGNLNMYSDADLIVAKFNSEGDFMWSNIIPKLQVSTKNVGLGIKIGPPFFNIQYFGYISGISDNKLYIAYNDKRKNFTLKDRKKVAITYSRKRSVPMLYSIDLSTGKSEMKQLYNPKQIKTYLKTRICYQKDSKSDIIAISQNKGYYQLVRIKLN